ncbi:MetQ/NlpA family ABC transporter substrate-binding protein [Corynebacterium marinum]|uniref:ABC transporter periplasmic component n=1 Tax=Corynebacterium marinum DSM 44953 TaxID=1224162 RepID=A0A0B6TPB5_9CORY|nr:MetQ/NlpA family ABC transporter substrate-binding protein [Corynebacterium marinum]AJK68099.1 ABC transporter periplasmic component [Corynebacterium marinum DSM 44953]GGO10820.1 methionine ABC transporter substrate-binding protein [Corynebacterium marinum]
MNFRRIFAGATASVIAAAGLVACSSDSDSTDAGAAGETVRIGTTDANLKEWDVFADLAEEEGIDIEIVPFSDYNTPNDAVAQGQIDVNKFQHLLFLNDYNTGAGEELVPISSTEIYPLALFWKDRDNLDGIEGEEIAIPNDATNQGRAINVLVQAGLVTLREEGLLNPAPADIDNDASKVSVIPVDAAQTTAVFHEGRPAVINNSFLERASIDPLDAIFQDDPDTEQAEPYINVWVTTPERADDETINRLAELWKDQAVTDAIMESSGNTAVKVDRPREDLDAILERLRESGDQ